MLPLTVSAERRSPSGRPLEVSAVTVTGFRYAGRLGDLAICSFGSLRPGYECTLEGRFLGTLSNVSATSWHVVADDLPALRRAYEHWLTRVRNKKRRALAR